LSIRPDNSGSPNAAANEALVEFFKAHHDDLRRFLRTRVCDPEDERRIAQQVYLDLLQHPPASLNPSYLFEAAENLARDPFGIRSTRDWLRRLIFFETPRSQAAAAESDDRSASIAEWQTHLANESSTGHSRYRIAWWIAGIVALLAVLGLVGWWAARESDSITTGVGEHKQVVLSDGSRIELGGNSAVTMATAVGLRVVALDHGEALFKVAQHANRPFQVIAENATITSPGAEFNVRRRDGGQVAVTVAAGTVKIGLNDLSASRQLHEGQQVIYDKAGQFSTIVPVTDESPLAWRDGLLVYESEPLKFIVADLNRYSARRIEIGDREAGDALLTGVVYEWDIDNWLPLLPQAVPGLDVIVDKHRVLIRTHRPEPE